MGDVVDVVNTFPIVTRFYVSTITIFYFSFLTISVCYVYYICRKALILLTLGVVNISHFRLLHVYYVYYIQKTDGNKSAGSI